MTWFLIRSICLVFVQSFSNLTRLMRRDLIMMEIRNAIIGVFFATTRSKINATLVLCWTFRKHIWLQVFPSHLKFFKVQCKFFITKGGIPWTLGYGSESQCQLRNCLETLWAQYLLPFLSKSKIKEDNEKRGIPSKRGGGATYIAPVLHLNIQLHGHNQ